jgi:hypothetical protein
VEVIENKVVRRLAISSIAWLGLFASINLFGNDDLVWLQVIVLYLGNPAPLAVLPLRGEPKRDVPEIVPASSVDHCSIGSLCVDAINRLRQAWHLSHELL